MATTKVTTGVITDGTITSTDMAVDPTDASTLASGTVPTARLGSGTASATTFLRGDQSYAVVDTSGILANQDDIALLGFKVAANGSLARYNLVDQSIDAFEDASGVDAAASTDEKRNSSGNYYSGVSAGTYVYSALTSTGAGTWTAPADTTEAEVIIVAGGGSGGCNHGGGAGAGGVVHNAAYTVVPAVVYDITVGAGGDAGGCGTSPNGDDSVFNVNSEGSGVPITAIGGGAGGSASYDTNRDGGSGGGGTGHGSAARLAGKAGTQTDSGGGTGYGNNGGDGFGSVGAGAGGGGAGGVGETTGSPADQDGGVGGLGRLFSNFTSYGVSGYFAGGGGGGPPSGYSGGAATSGGGAGGAYGGTGVAATANTGGGGGGGGGNAGAGGDGGSGTVIIRSAPGVVDDMILISNAQTAQTAPTKAHLVFTYTNGAGTAVLGTNITAEVSMDNGSTYTNLSIGASDSQGTTGGHTIVTKNDVTLTSTSGTSMRYRIKTLVQSASLDTRIHAVSLGWS